jgi:outer membrane biosynthesis protein TonB
VRACSVALLLIVGCATTYRELEPLPLQRLPITISTDRVPQLLRERYAGQTLHAEARFYADYNGETGRVVLLKSTGEPAIDAYVLAEMQQMHRPGQRARDTFRVPIDVPVEAQLPPHAPNGYTAVPPHYFDDRVLSRPTPHLPAVVKIQRIGSELRVTYVVFVEADGSVSHVQPLEPHPDVDPALTATLMTWRFVPPNQRLRFLASFVFRVDTR